MWHLIKPIWNVTKNPIIISVYFIVGVAIYMSQEEHEDCTDATPSVCTYEGWTLIDALYFSMTTVSTVGYGDLSPGTDFTKFFTCVYIIVGVAIVFPAMAGNFDFIMDTVERLVMLLCHNIKVMTVGHTKKQGVDVDGDGDIDNYEPPSFYSHYGRGLWFPLTSMIVVVLLVSAAVFTALEEEWTYWEGVYHCWITSTTVGYGDMSISTQGGRLWATCHIFLAVVWLLTILNRIILLQNQRKRQLQQKSMMEKSLDVDLIKSLDKDGGGVDKLEFIAQMLITLGAELCGSPLQWSDVEPFIHKFDALDVDGSGKLTATDLEKMVQAELEKQQKKKALRKSKTVVGSLSPSR